MFQVKQRVICIHRGPWRVINSEDPSSPVYGRVYVVDGVGRSEMYEGGVWIGLDGWRDTFAASCFRPLTEDPKRVEETMERWFNQHLEEPVSGHSSMVEPLASNQMTTGSIPAGRSSFDCTPGMLAGGVEPFGPQGWSVVVMSPRVAGCSGTRRGGLQSARPAKFLKEGVRV